MKYLQLLLLILVYVNLYSAEQMQPVFRHQVKAGINIGGGKGIKTRSMLDSCYQTNDRFKQSIDAKNGATHLYYNTEMAVFYMWIIPRDMELPLVKNGDLQTFQNGIHCQFWPTGGGLPVIIKNKITITHVNQNKLGADYPEHYSAQDIVDNNKTIIAKDKAAVLLKVTVDFKDHVLDKSKKSLVKGFSFSIQ